MRDETVRERGLATVQPAERTVKRRSQRSCGGRTWERDVRRAAVMDSGVPLIVIADRDRLHEGLVTAALTDLGYEVLTARTIWELQRLVETRHIDVLLVDLALFGSSVTFLNGVIFARRPLLVILMLALGTGLTPDVARTSGFDACFSKIVDVKRLDGFLRDHLPLSRRPPRRQAGADSKRF